MNNILIFLVIVHWSLFIYIRIMMYFLSIITSFIVPFASAGEWEKLFNDLDRFEQVLESDTAQLDNQQSDTLLENSADLFPAVEKEDEQPQSLEEEEFATITVQGQSVQLFDVPLEEWFAEFILDIADKELISGYRDADGKPTGEFGPADFVTREQLAKMAVTAAGIDVYNCGDTLKNSSARGTWSQRYVQCAEYHRWIVFSDGTAKLTKPAYRSEVVVTVLQAFAARISPVSGTVFNDVSRATPYGNAVETAARDGVVSGYSASDGSLTGYFGPSDPVNRAETAKIFSLSFQRYSL